MAAVVAPAAAAPSGTRGSAVAKPRIVLLDLAGDDGSRRLLLRMFARQCNLEVEVCESVADACRALEPAAGVAPAAATLVFVTGASSQAAALVAACAAVRRALPDVAAVAVVEARGEATQPRCESSLLEAGYAEVLLQPLPNAKAKACVRRWTGYHDPGWTIG